MHAPRHDRASLLARINTSRAEIEALRARLKDREVEVYRLFDQLGRIPSDAPEVAQTPSRSWVPIKAAARQSGKSVDTLRRHGKPAGWVWKQGGRLVVDPTALDDWMSGPQARS